MQALSTLHASACSCASAYRSTSDGRLVIPIFNVPRTRGLSLTRQQPLVPVRAAPSSHPGKSVQTHFKTEESPQPDVQSATQQPLQSGRHVVLAIDSSADSELAVVWAVHNILKPGDAVHIYHMTPGTHSEHIFSTPSSHVVKVDTSMAYDADKKLHDDGVQMARQIIARYGPRLAKMQVQLQAHVMPITGAGGKQMVGQVLCEQAAALHAAAVVLVSRSHGGLAELIRGSVADYVVKHATCPVAVLHLQQQPQRGAPSSTATQQLLSSPSSGSNRQLVLAVDDTQDSLATCRWVLDNIYHSGDVVHMVHVVPCLPLSVPFTGSDFLMHPGLQAEPDIMAMEQRLAESEARGWEKRQAQPFKDLMEQAGAQYTFDVMVHHTEDPVMAISNTIISKAEELHSAVVVLCHHDRAAIAQFFMGSVANQVVHHCDRPVVVLHGKSMKLASSPPAAGAAPSDAPAQEADG